MGTPQRRCGTVPRVPTGTLGLRHGTGQNYGWQLLPPDLCSPSGGDHSSQALWG